LVISWFGDRFRNNNIEGIRSDLQIIVGSILGLVKVLGGDDFDFFIFIFIVIINFFYFVLVRTSIGSMNFVGLLIIVIVIVLVLALIYRKLSLSIIDNFASFWVIELSGFDAKIIDNSR
jgi:hypothetical protein